MAVTCRDIIRRALIALKVLPAARAPSASMAADGLASLQGMFDQMVERQTFGPLTAVLMTAAYTPAENEAVSGAFGVTLPATITDADTLLVRAPLDRALIAVAANATMVNTVAVTGPQCWVYDARAAAWVALHDLDLNDDCPFGGRFSDGLVNMLAIRLSDDFGGQVTAKMAEMARRCEYEMTRRDSIKPAPVAPALLLTSNRRGGGVW